MKITVEIPTAFRRFTNGSASVECAPFINVYVNEEDIRFLGGETYRFQDGDRVMIVPSIAGG